MGDILTYSRYEALITSDRRPRDGSSVTLRFRHPQDFSVVEIEGVVKWLLVSETEDSGTRFASPRFRVEFAQLLVLVGPVAC